MFADKLVKCNLVSNHNSTEDGLLTRFEIPI